MSQTDDKRTCLYTGGIARKRHADATHWQNSRKTKKVRWKGWLAISHSWKDVVERQHKICAKEPFSGSKTLGLMEEPARRDRAKQKCWETLLKSHLYYKRRKTP